MTGKLFSTSLLLILLSAACVAQTYTVVHVEGTLFHGTSRTKMSTADQLLPTDSIHFIRQQAWAIVVSPAGELLFVQNPEEQPVVKPLSGAMIPIERSKHSLSKKNAVPISDLKTYFQGEQFVFIGTHFNITVDPKSYPLDEKLFLLYRYEYNSRIITHKLPATKQQVVTFDPTYLYEYKGEKIPYQKTTKTELSYFNSNTSLPTLAAAFRPIWLEEEALKKELQVLKQIYSSAKKSKEELKVLYLSYVLDIYGKTDEGYFIEWLEKAGL